MTDTTARRRMAIVGFVTPAVLALIGAGIQIALFPRLPDPIASHWNGAGLADGFSPQWALPLMTLGAGALIPALLVLTTLSADRINGGGGDGHGAAAYSTTHRFLGALGLGLGTMLTVMMTASAFIQLDLGDAADAPSIVPSMLLGAGIGVLLGLIGWLVLPKGSPREKPSAAPAMPLTDSQSAVWIQRVSIARSGVIVLGACVLLLVVMGGLLLLSEDAGVWPSVLVSGIGVLLGLLVLSTSVFRVTVDASGLTARSVMGWPRTHIPAAEVASAAVVQVNPMAEFGGWGLRWGPAGYGIVLRTGEGIAVTRANGKVFTVTVDDAATGAALLQAEAERARARH